MFFQRKKTTLPSADEALPGRTETMPVPERHFVNGNPLTGPFPEGMQRAMFGMGCFWGAERCFWEIPGVHTTAAGYAAGHTPNPSYQEVCSGRTGHNEVVLVVFDPARVPYESLLQTFWEGHDPTQGMRQGNDVGTQYRSGIYVVDAAQRTAAESSRDAYAAALAKAGLGALLRRGLSPAVPGKEPGGVLRPRRHRRVLPRRNRRHRLSRHPATRARRRARDFCRIIGSLTVPGRRAFRSRALRCAPQHVRTVSPRGGKRPLAGRVTRSAAARSRCRPGAGTHDA
jgi:peptide-methionine (S)-S-oxide reductase